MKKYQKQIQELESEKHALQKENEDLRSKLSDVLSSSNRLRKLNGLEEQVSVMKKKVEAQSQMSSQKLVRDVAMKNLQNEILSLKAQKAESQRKMKEESVQFRLCKALLEKEVLQLKKNERKKDYVMDKLLVLNQRMKMVMQRKMEEAFMSTKRLKEFLESRKASSHGKSGSGDHKGPRNQPLLRGIEDKTEIKARINGLCSEYDRQMKEMVREVAELKREAELSKQNDSGCILQDIEVDCIRKEKEILNLLQGIKANHKDKDTKIRELKEQVAKLSDLVKQLEIQKDKQISTGQPKDSTSSEDSKEDAGKSQDSRSSITYNHQAVSSVLSEAKNLEHSEGVTASTTKNSSVLCCLCSNKSLCKTNKCKCRATGANCGTSCSCALKKCANRDAVSVKLDDSPASEVLNGMYSGGSVVLEETTSLAVHGAMLLQGALREKPAKISDSDEPRKPLSDIGNTIKTNAPKPSRRKKNRKSIVQPAPAPLPSLQEGDVRAPEQSGVSAADMVAPKILRTTRSTTLK